MNRRIKAMIMALLVTAAIPMAKYTPATAVENVTNSTSNTGGNPETGTVSPDNNTKAGQEGNNKVKSGINDKNRNFIIHSNITPTDPTDFKFTDEETKLTYDENGASRIVLKDGTPEVTNAEIDGKDIKITKAGTYVVSGTASDIRILVDAGENENVVLILKGAQITSSKGSAVFVESGNITLNVPEGTESIITGGERESNNLVGAVGTRGNLIINGKGNLKIQGSDLEALASAGNVTVNGTRLDLNSYSSGIVSLGTVKFKDSELNIDCRKTGIISQNSEDQEHSDIYSENSVVGITSNEGAMESLDEIKVNGGVVRIKTVDGSSEDSGETDKEGSVTGMENSSKPSDNESNTAGKIMRGRGMFPRMMGNNFGFMKRNHMEGPWGRMMGFMGEGSSLSASSFTLMDGEMTVDTPYTGIDAMASLDIQGGTLNINAGRKAIHTMNALKTSGGTVNINEGGTFNDDTENTSNGNDSGAQNDRNSVAQSSENNFPDFEEMSKEMEEMMSQMDHFGMGMDNFPLVMEITGGNIIYTSRGDISPALTDTTTQAAIEAVADKEIAAGTNAEIVDETGNAVVTITPSAAFKSIMISSPLLKKDGKYSLKAGDVTVDAKVMENMEPDNSSQPENNNTTPSDKNSSQPSSL